MRHDGLISTSAGAQVIRQKPVVWWQRLEPGVYRRLWWLQELHHRVGETADAEIFWI